MIKRSSFAISRKIVRPKELQRMRSALRIKVKSPILNMSLSDLSRQKPALKALAMRFTHHDFERANVPRSPIFNNGRYIPLSSVQDLSGKPVEYSDLVIGSTFLAHCRVPLSQPASNLYAHWHEPSAIHAFQHYIFSDGHCFDFNWKEDADGGLIDIDEILASPLYTEFWKQSTSNNRTPQRHEFFGFFLPKISYHQEPNGDKIILRSDWEHAMPLINPKYSTPDTNVVAP